MADLLLAALSEQQLLTWNLAPTTLDRRLTGVASPDSPSKGTASELSTTAGALQCALIVIAIDPSAQEAHGLAFVALRELLCTSLPAQGLSLAGLRAFGGVRPAMPHADGRDSELVAAWGQGDESTSDGGVSSSKSIDAKRPLMDLIVGDAPCIVAAVEGPRVFAAAGIAAAAAGASCEGAHVEVYVSASAHEAAVDVPYFFNELCGASRCQVERNA